MMEKLPTIAKSTWRMPMREVSTYINKIDRFFQRDELKLDIDEDKLYWKKHEDEDGILESEEYILKIQRISHDTKYSLFLKSSAVMIYSAFENSLFSVAQTASCLINDRMPLNEFQLKPKYSRLRGIESFKIYLQKIHNINWDELNYMWARIKGFRFVRNKIVHNGGKLNLNDFRIFKKFSDQEIGLSSKDEIIFIELDYLTEIVDVMTYFLDELCRRLGD